MAKSVEANGNAAHSRVSKGYAECIAIFDGPERTTRAADYVRMLSLVPELAAEVKRLNELHDRIYAALGRHACAESRIFDIEEIGETNSDEPITEADSAAARDEMNAAHAQLSKLFLEMVSTSAASLAAGGKEGERNHEQI